MFFKNERSTVKMKNHFLFYTAALIIIIACTNPANAQDTDIVSYLKKIERGDLQSVEAKLPELKKDFPNSPSVKFLEGVLAKNGETAVSIYLNLVKNYPRSRYADAALYRIYSYYYSLGMFNAAAGYLNKLKTDYPDSPYLDIAKKKIPPKDNPVIGLKKEESGEKEVKDKKAVSKDKEEYGYTIQAGAFTVGANADKLKKEFEKAGYSSRVEEKTVAGTAFQIVYVGKFVNNDDAEQFLKLINTKFDLQGRVVKLEK